jgi:hypothetical protein
MKNGIKQETVEYISSYIHNFPLSESVCQAIETGLSKHSVHFAGGNTLWEVFKHSLDAAIKDIEDDPRGILFKRLIRYGPYFDTEPHAPTSDGKTVLSDPEWGKCVEFIFSYMINRFKGELAEVLSIQPCLKLVEKLEKENRLPGDIHVYWGNTIREYSRIVGKKDKKNPVWGRLTKGADGLLVENIYEHETGLVKKVKIHGIVEIKSMRVSRKKILEQIDRHARRLSGGLELLKNKFPGERVEIVNPGLIKIMIIPSNWKLSREFHFEEDEDGTKKMVFPEPEHPGIDNEIKELEPGVFRITLSWSKEALEQAGYEMTYGYMAEVGQHVYSNQDKELPEAWKGMSPAEAGYNAIKQALYYMPLRGRFLSKRKTRLAIRLYNVYSFGYPFGIGSKKMLWPDDISAKSRWPLGELITETENSRPTPASILNSKSK